MSNEVKYYILDGHTPVRATLEEWSKGMSATDRTVARDVIGDVTISTVFIGMGWDNHIFETMIFGGPHDQYQDRCDTWDEAIKMHKRALDVLQNNTLGEPK